MGRKWVRASEIIEPTSTNILNCYSLVVITVILSTQYVELSFNLELDATGGLGAAPPVEHHVGSVSLALQLRWQSKQNCRNLVSIVSH
jgi:hypothetical protein